MLMSTAWGSITVHTVRALLLTVSEGVAWHTELLSLSIYIRLSVSNKSSTKDIGTRNKSMQSEQEISSLTSSSTRLFKNQSPVESWQPHYTSLPIASQNRASFQHLTSLLPWKPLDYSKYCIPHFTLPSWDVRELAQWSERPTTDR